VTDAQMVPDTRFVSDCSQLLKYRVSNNVGGVNLSLTVAIIKDGHARIIIMRPEIILHARGRIHFRRLLLV
jgi:hypothetical protein